MRSAAKFCAGVGAKCCCTHSLAQSLLAWVPCRTRPDQRPSQEGKDAHRMRLGQGPAVAVPDRPAGGQVCLLSRAGGWPPTSKQAGSHCPGRSLIPDIGINQLGTSLGIPRYLWGYLSMYLGALMVLQQRFFLSFSVTSEHLHIHAYNTTLAAVNDQ